MSARAFEIAATSLAVASLLTMGGPASAADFYKGKTITVQVPSGPGGTFHVYCQIVAGQLGKHVPGSPNVIIQNLPGAGGAKSAAYMMNVAPKNGTYIAMVAPGVITDPLIRKHKYDARKFEWLGSVAARPFTIAMWHTTPFKTLDDLKKSESTLGTSGVSSSGYIVPVFVNAVLGTKMKVIAGYKSGGETNMAIERGEVQGRGNFYSGFTGVRPDWITDNKLNFVLGIGPRHAALKDVPHLRDLLPAGSTEAKMYELIEVNFNVGQAFYAPPRTEKSNLATLRTAFAAMLADPELVKEIERRKVEYHPQSAAEVEKHVVEAYKAAEPEVVKRLQKILGGEKKGS